MYSWIWRRLPFGLPGKIGGSLALAIAAGVLLWYVVFPWAEPLMPFDDVQVTQDGTSPGAEDPALDDNAIPYNTTSNNPPPSPSKSTR
jgi:hypothetical protein